MAAFTSLARWSPGPSHTTLVDATSDPYIEAEVWISAEWVEEAYADGWWQRDVLDEELDLWDSGQMTVGNETRRAVRWLDDQTSARVARQVFNADLDALREERTGPVP